MERIKIIILSLLLSVAVFGQVPTKLFYNNTGANALGYFYGAIKWRGQTFTTGNDDVVITKIVLKTFKKGSPSGLVYVDIYATSGGYPTGSVIATGTYEMSSISASHPTGEEKDIAFNFSASANTMYAFIIRHPNGNSNNNTGYNFKYLDNVYQEGKHFYTDNAGGLWETPDLGNDDLWFEVWGYADEPSGATYYVSNSGNDNNTGLSEGQAWKTLSKVNSSSFNPGDQILLKRGDTWRETLAMPSSGEENNHIYIGAYGQGNNPIIDGSDLLTIWTEEILSESEDVLMEPQEMVEQKESIFRWWSRKYVATDFTATGTYDLTAIEVNLDKVGSPAMNIACYLYSDVSGNPTSVLATSSTTLIAASIINGTWHSFTFDGSYEVQNNTSYWIVLVASVADDNNYVHWNSRSSGGVIVGSETGKGEWEKIVGWNGSYRVKGTSASFKSYWATATSPNAAWEDGVYMIKKQSKESLSEGSFYWDGDNNRIYVKTTGDDDPSGYTIVAAKRDHGITSNDKAYISIDSVTVRYTNVSGITSTSNSSYVYISNSELYGNGIGVNFHGANGLVTKSTIKDGHMIVNDLSPYNDYGAVGVNIENVNITVSYSTFENLYASSFDYGEDGGGIEVFQYAIPVVENIEIYNNYFKNVSGILEIGGNGGTVRNVTMYNNVSYDDRPWNGGIAINNSGMYGVSINNIALYNNTILSVGSNSGAYAWFASNPSAGHFVMKNNIFYVSNITVITAQTLQAADHTNNLYWNPLNVAWTPGYALGAGEIIDDPLFVNAQNDFRLLSTSPTIDAGVNVGVSKDFLDNNRVGLPDIGAYEYIPVKILPTGSYANFIDGVQYLSYIGNDLYSKWVVPYVVPSLPPTPPLEGEAIVFNGIIDWDWTLPQNYGGNGFYWWHMPDEKGITNYGDMPTDDWTTPYDYENGEFYMRIEVIEQPTAKPFQIQFGIWQDYGVGNYPESVCERERLIGGEGSYIEANIGSPSVWWQKENDNPVDYTRADDFYRIGIVLWNDNPLCLVKGQAWADPGCPEYAEDFFPMKVKVTVVAVADGYTFSGWGNYTISGEPIKVNPINKYYFTYKNEPTIIVTSGEHYGAVLNTDFDYDTYFETLVADGLNGTRISSGTNVEYQGWFDIVDNTWAPASGKYLAPWARSSTAGYAGGGNKFDLDIWDENYFNRLHDFMSKAYDKDIIVEYFMFTQIYEAELWNYNPMKYSNNVNGVGNINYNDGVYNTTGNDLLPYQKAFVKKVVTELNKYPNLIWEIANEPYWSNVSQAAIPVAWSDSIVKWITETEAQLTYKHLISQNVGNYSVVSQEPRTGVGIMNFHYANTGTSYTNQLYRELILGSNETGFTQSDSQYRAEAYIALMSGAAYFNNLDYSFTVDDPTGQEAPSGNPAGGNPTLRKQLGIAKSFIESFDFIKMSPNNAVVTDITAGRTAYALVESGKQYAIYINGGSSVSIQVNLPAGTYDISWIDTKTGNASGASTFVHGGGNKSMGATYSEDILLKIVVGVEGLEDYDIFHFWDFEDLPLNQEVPPNYFGTPQYTSYSDGSSMPGYYNLYQTKIVEIERDGKMTKALRIEQSPTRSATEIFALLGALYDEVYMTFSVQYGTNFQSIASGKMPGMAGGKVPKSSNVETFVPYDEGWKYRLLFDRAGIQNIYIYDHSRSNPSSKHYTHSNYPPYGTADRYNNTGNWYNITQRYVMNTTSGAYDGIYEAWVDEQKVMGLNNRRYYENSLLNANKIDKFVLSHFYGGDGVSFYPTQTTYVYLDNITVWKPKNPTVSGNNTYSFNYKLNQPYPINDREFYYDYLVTSPGTLSNQEYGGQYSNTLDEKYLIDAGAGKTVTFNYSVNLAATDYLLIYDGNTTDSEMIVQHRGSMSQSGQPVTSTGRYMFVRFVTDKANTATGFTGTLTFD